jgi:hypothetical protein
MNLDRRLTSLEKAAAYMGIRAPGEDPRKLLLERITRIAERAQIAPEAIPIEITFQQFDDRI